MSGLGVNASGTVEIFLTDVLVPAADRLGEEGEGFKIAMSTLDGGRIGIAAQAVGIAQEAFEAATHEGRGRFAAPHERVVRHEVREPTHEEEHGHHLEQPGAEPQPRGQTDGAGRRVDVAFEVVDRDEPVAEHDRDDRRGTQEVDVAIAGGRRGQHQLVQA